MMWKLIAVVAIVFVALPANALWEKNTFYAEYTQSLKIRFAGERDEGVLMLKHFKYRRPIYLVSTFVGTKVKKTKLVSKRAFYRLYGELYALVGNPASEKKVTSRCKSSVAVTLTVKDEPDRANGLCLDEMGLQFRKKFSNWYINIKEKL